MAFGETITSRHRLLMLSVLVAMVMTLIDANSRDQNVLSSDLTVSLQCRIDCMTFRTMIHLKSELR